MIMKQTPSSNRPSMLLALDTTSGSILHKLFGYANRSTLGRTFPLSTIYIASLALTFFPLLIAVLLGPLSLSEITPTHKLPFLYDWNVLFMFLISFPSLVICIANDQNILLSSLMKVEADESLVIDKENASRVCILWKKRFRKINYFAYTLGLIAGATVVYFNYVAYTPASVGYWIAQNGKLVPVGFVLLYCVFLFYCLVPLLIFRIVGVTLLLRDIVAFSRLCILPLHPDKSGGLRPMGNLGLRNQYLLTIFGLNIALMIAIPFRYLHAPITLYTLTIFAVISYIIIGPIIFIAPLMPFRKGMLAMRDELMKVVSRRMRIELDRLNLQMNSEAINKEDADSIEMLQKIASVVDLLPTWPFDASIMRRFIVAFVIPLISSLIAKAISIFVISHFK